MNEDIYSQTPTYGVSELYVDKPLQWRDKGIRPDEQVSRAANTHACQICQQPIFDLRRQRPCVRVPDRLFLHIDSALNHSRA